MLCLALHQSRTGQDAPTVWTEGSKKYPLPEELDRFLEPLGILLRHQASYVGDSTRTWKGTAETPRSMSNAITIFHLRPFVLVYFASKFLGESMHNQQYLSAGEHATNAEPGLSSVQANPS